MERLNTNGVHDFNQQLANHYPDLLRVAGNRPLDREMRAHFMGSNAANQPREARASARFALLADFFPISIPLFLRLRQALDDTLCKMLVNLAMPRYRF